MSTFGSRSARSGQWDGDAVVPHTEMNESRVSHSESCHGREGVGIRTSSRHRRPRWKRMKRIGEMSEWYKEHPQVDGPL